MRLRLAADYQFVAKAQGAEEQALQAHAEMIAAIVRFYRVPAVKFVLRLTAHLLLLVLYADVLVTAPNAMQAIESLHLPPLRWQEVVFTFWVFSVGVDERHQSLERRRRKAEKELSSSFEGLIDFGQRLLVFGLCMRWCAVLVPFFGTAHFWDRLARVLYIVYHVIISLDVILISLELLSFLSVVPHFGVLVIMVCRSPP